MPERVDPLPYLVNETLKNAIEEAEELGAKDIKLRIMAANVLGKFNRSTAKMHRKCPRKMFFRNPLNPRC